MSVSERKVVSYGADSRSAAPWLVAMIAGFVLLLIGGISLRSTTSDVYPNAAKFLVGFAGSAIGMVLVWIGVVALAVELGTAKLRAQIDRLLEKS